MTVRAWSRNATIVAVAVLPVVAGSHGTTPEDGRVELLRVRYMQFTGKHSSTASYTYFDIGSNYGRFDGYQLLSINLRTPRLLPDQQGAVVEGTFLLSTPLTWCHTKGYIEESEVAVRKVGNRWHLSGDLSVVTARCPGTVRFVAEKTTMKAELWAEENAAVLSYFNDTFFETFPEREGWKDDAGADRNTPQ